VRVQNVDIRRFLVKILIGAMLLIAGIIDIKSQKISRLYIALLMLVCVMTVIVDINQGTNQNIMSMLMGALIGICAVGISMMAGEQIGRGDGLVITAIGIVLGFRGVLGVVCLASLVMCVIAVILLILRKGNKNTRLPFIPAIFVGYAIYMTSFIM
jgi:leader peptidase (prepilin peptidase)/N-methyltransferase